MLEFLLEVIKEWNPFWDLFEKLGFTETESIALTGILLALLGIGGRLAYRRFENIRAARKLPKPFDYQTIKAACDLFIPTQSQNISPSQEDEPAAIHKYVVKKLLIRFFIKTGFNEKKEKDKFYLVLADSGMGKTTFMINLYMAYTSFFNIHKKHDIRLFSFADDRILDQIRQIEPAGIPNTILLLDAFDEDKKLIPPAQPDGLTDDERFRKRLDDIIETVRDFREVVITSRTQYFPGQENESYELKIPTFDERGFHTLGKFYISPFDRKEIRRFLNKKYGIFQFWNRNKKRIAMNVVNNAPKLMVRPMLLSYIDYLVEGERTYETTGQIYETLVEKWLEREAKKRRYESKARESFKENLRRYSEQVAMEIYRQRKENNALYLPRARAIAVARENDIDLGDYEITGQSLLTRDGEGSWKFAHKSIWEFWVAKEAAKNPELLVELAHENFQGMDVTRQFCNEIFSPVFLERAADFVLVKGGVFLMGSADDDTSAYDDEKPRHKVKVSDFYIAKTPVTQKQWREVMGNNPSHFKDCDNCPVESVSWEDTQRFIEKLNAQGGKGSFRLPTEAQWEYATRRGHKAPFLDEQARVYANGKKYAGSNNLDEVGWYKENSQGKTHPVGEKEANELGLYDMSGNVWEWCEDWYGGNYYEACQKEGIVENPSGPANGSFRVLRGGSWFDDARDCRVAFRYDYSPGGRDDGVGFRLVFVP